MPNQNSDRVYQLYILALVVLCFVVFPNQEQQRNRVPSVGPRKQRCTIVWNRHNIACEKYTTALLNRVFIFTFYVGGHSSNQAPSIFIID